MRAILMFDNCNGQSHKTVSTDYNFWRERRAEADSNQCPSAYQPNALPLGQTGSQDNAYKPQLTSKKSRSWESNRRRPLTSLRPYRWATPAYVSLTLFRQRKTLHFFYRTVLHVSCVTGPVVSLPLSHWPESFFSKRLMVIHSRLRCSVAMSIQGFRSELRSCVEVEVAVLGFPSLIVLKVSVDVK